MEYTTSSAVSSRPLTGGFWMPPHALAQAEHVRGLAGLAPGFGQVAFQDEGAGLHRRPGLVLEQPAVREAVDDLGLEGDYQVGVESGAGPRHAASRLRRAWGSG